MTEEHPPEHYSIHRQMCCSKHGCHYNDPVCPVVIGKLTQEHPCGRYSVCKRSTEERSTFWDNVHRVHCCTEHGCIYEEANCPVVTGKVKRYGEKCPRCEEEDAARELLHPGYQAERPEPPPLPPPGQYSNPDVPLSGECSYRELHLAELEARIKRREPPPTQQIGLKCGGPRPGLFGDRLDRIFTAIACTFVCLGLAFGFIAGLIYGVLTS